MLFGYFFKRKEIEKLKKDTQAFKVAQGRRVDELTEKSQQTIKNSDRILAEARRNLPHIPPVSPMSKCEQAAKALCAKLPTGKEKETCLLVSFKNCIRAIPKDNDCNYDENRPPSP